MTLKIYDKLDDVPEALRAEYRLSDGKYVPDLTDHHPTLVKNRELIARQSTDKAAITRLTNEKTALENNVLPAGHKAVPEDDARFLEEVKPLGTAKEIKARETEFKTLKEQSDSRAADEVLEWAGKELGYQNLATFKAVMKSLKVGVTKRSETVDGKAVEKPVVGEKSLADYIQGTAELKASEEAFKSKPTQAAPNSEAGAGSRPVAAAVAGAGAETKEQAFRFQEAGDVTW